MILVSVKSVVSNISLVSHQIELQLFDVTVPTLENKRTMNSCKKLRNKLTAAQRYRNNHGVLKKYRKEEKKCVVKT